NDLARRCLESVQRGFHAVFTWRQSCDAERPLSIAHRFNRGARGLIDGSDGRAGNRTSQRVTNEATDEAGGILRLCRWAQRDNEDDDNREESARHRNRSKPVVESRRWAPGFIKDPRVPQTG